MNRQSMINNNQQQRLPYNIPLANIHQNIERNLYSEPFETTPAKNNVYDEPYMDSNAGRNDENQKTLIYSEPEYQDLNDFRRVVNVNDLYSQVKK